MIKIGIVGAGQHSKLEHGPALRQVAGERPDNVCLAAICDLNAESAADYARKFGFERSYSDMDSMLEHETLDGIAVISPVPATRAMVGKLLPLGIPLLIEKLPGSNLREAGELLDIATKCGTPHMVSFNRRFHVALTRARDWLQSRAADRPPRFIAARMLRIKRREPSFVWSTGIHAADAVLSLAPRPMRVCSRRYLTPEGGHCCQARIEFETGTEATLNLAPDCGAHEETYELFGADYCVQIDTAHHALTVWEGGVITESWTASGIGAQSPSYLTSGVIEETRAFLDAVTSGTGFSPTLADGIMSMQVAQAMHAGGEHELG